MTQLSVRQAAGAGFRLIGREPLAVLGWAALYLVLAAAAAALLGATFGNFFVVLAQAGDAEPAFSDMLALQMQMMATQSLFMLGALGLQTVMMGAVFRAVLQPEERRWAYLRLSSQELWLAIVYFVLSFGIGVAAGMLLFPVAALAAFLGIAFRDSLGAWGMAMVGIPGLIALIAVTVWLMLRLCLAYPMSFAERNFRLFESWAATRGHAGRLFLVFLLTTLAVLTIQLAGFVLFAGILIAAIGPQWQALLAGDPLLLFRTVAPLTALFVVLGSALSAVTAVIATAPLADVYRQLAASDA